MLGGVVMRGAFEIAGTRRNTRGPAPLSPYVNAGPPARACFHESLYIIHHTSGLYHTFSAYAYRLQSASVLQVGGSSILHTYGAFLEASFMQYEEYHGVMQSLSVLHDVGSGGTWQ